VAGKIGGFETLCLRGLLFLRRLAFEVVVTIRKGMKGVNLGKNRDLQ